MGSFRFRPSVQREGASLSQPRSSCTTSQSSSLALAHTSSETVLGLADKNTDEALKPEADNEAGLKILEENTDESQSRMSLGSREPNRDYVFWDRLSDIQREVLQAARNRAKEASEAALPGLIERFQKLGYSRDTLASVLHYIEGKAPLLIHFNPDRAFLTPEGTKSTVLNAFLSDSRYRNQFETGISGGCLGSSRDAWERTLFQGNYHQRGGETPSGERPKYGSLNLFQIVRGSAPGYGPCYFELRADVRRRCTFTFGMSSGNTGESLATCEHFAHILEKFTDNQIRCLAKGWPYDVPLLPVNFVIEAQIHGPVEFNQDIEALLFCRPHGCTGADRKQIQGWSRENGFTCLILEECPIYF